MLQDSTLFRLSSFDGSLVVDDTEHKALIQKARRCTARLAAQAVPWLPCPPATPAQQPSQGPSLCPAQAHREKTLSFGFSAGGCLFSYYVGVAAALQDAGVLTGAQPIGPAGARGRAAFQAAALQAASAAPRRAAPRLLPARPPTSEPPSFGAEETKIGGASAGSLIAACIKSGMPMDQACRVEWGGVVGGGLCGLQERYDHHGPGRPPPLQYLQYLLPAAPPAAPVPGAAAAAGRPPLRAGAAPSPAATPQVVESCARLMHDCRVNGTMHRRGGAGRGGRSRDGTAHARARHHLPTRPAHAPVLPPKRLGPLLEALLEESLPEDAHLRCRDRAYVSPPARPPPCHCYCSVTATAAVAHERCCRRPPPPPRWL